MKAITLWQPWASLMSIGEKRFETRSWSTKHRGEMAIHAAKMPISKIPLPNATFVLMQSLLERGGLDIFDLPYGCVVAVGNLIEIFPTEEHWHRINIRAKDLELGDWSEGRFAWDFAEVDALDPPIPTRGSQGIWEWADERR